MTIQNNTMVNDTTDRELVMTRAFNAPRELVYEAWTKAEHVVNWWGPTGFINTTQEMEVKPGGTWRFILHAPDGNEYPNRIVYTEVLKPELLEFEYGADIDDDPEKFNVTVTFKEQNGITTIHMRMVFASAEQRDKVVKEHRAIEGNRQTMDRLENYLGGMDREDSFVITRTFNAPRQLVFEVFTQAEHLARWWGPKGFTIKVVKLDFRPGGIFHYVMQAGENEMWGRFIYREIVPPEKIVFVNSFSDAEGGITAAPMADNWPLEMLNVMTLTEHDGKTTLTIKGGPIHATELQAKIYHENHESMKNGFGGTFDQLDAYLASLKK